MILTILIYLNYFVAPNSSPTHWKHVSLKVGPVFGKIFSMIMEKVLSGIMENKCFHDHGNFFFMVMGKACQRKYQMKCRNKGRTNVETKCPIDPSVRPPSPIPSRPAHVIFFRPLSRHLFRPLFRHFVGYFLWLVFPVAMEKLISHGHGT